MSYITNKTFSEIKIGDSASISRTLSKQDIQLFAVMSGDNNPAHLDEAYAKTDIFHGIIAHGMWGGALISTVLGTQLPGPGTIYLNQTLKFLHPVKVGDSIKINVRVISKNKKHYTVILDCKCTNQDNIEVVSGKAEVIAPTKKIHRKSVKLPRLELKTPTEDRLYSTIIALKDKFTPLKTAVVHPIDGNSLGGAVAAAKESIITPILIGPKNKIEAIAKQNRINIAPYKIIDSKHSHQSAQIAAELANKDKVEAIMKGKIHTKELLQPIIDKENGLRTERRISHVFVLDVPTYHKLIFITDAAVNIAPDLLAKRDILQNSVDLFTTLGFGTPKVAVVSAVETIDVKLPSTIDAAALSKMAERGQITGAIVDGPLAFDNAISKAAAEAKDIVSTVAGDADIILVPDIESGNMLYKQMKYLFNIEGAGIAIGAKVPIILTSRAADKGTARVASSALALLYVRNKHFIKKPSTK